MTREEARDLLAMIKVKEPGEFIVNSWWGSFVNDYKEALQMAIEALEQEPCEDCISREIVKQLYYKDGYIEFSKICNLPSVTPKEKTGWIPVSERLPEECSGVLVYCPENKNIFLAYLEIGKWYIFSPNADEPIDEPIVAWMPLPKPYKPQESEDKE